MRGSMRAMTMAAAALLLCAPTGAQVVWETRDVACENGWGRSSSERYCEERVATGAAASALRIEPDQNGGVSVTGWSRDDIEVVAKVRAWAESESRAGEIAQDVRVGFASGLISAEGPRTGRRESWSVSFEVMVPVRTDLDIETLNGGISIVGVSGEVRFDATNGGVRLTDLSGDVRGRTTNGGLHVVLEGTRWVGEGMDVETTNGGLTIAVPEGYSAQLTTGTVNGGIEIDFPVTVRGRIGRRLTTTLGEGGAPVSATTTNGGVKITRAGGVTRR